MGQPRHSLGERAEVADLGLAVRGQAGERDRAHPQARDVGDHELEHVRQLEDDRRAPRDAPLEQV
jgi:hypothetical protein